MLTRDQEDMNRIVEDAETVSCDECNSKAFVEVYFLKRVSALISPTGQEVKIPVASFRCAECGSMNKDFLPPALREEFLGTETEEN